MYYLILFLIFVSMKIGAIITGDIVDSTKMTKSERTAMLQLLQSLSERLSPLCKTNIEIFRGDRFRLKVTEITKTLQITLAIRAIIRANKFAGNNEQWDARLAIGIGTLDYETDSLSTSDGEAYRLSGRGLDQIGGARLYIETPWEEVNKELMVSTLFADDIVTGWTQSQSRIMYEKLVKDQNQEQIGKILEVSQQSVSKTLKAAKCHIIYSCIGRFEELVTARTSLNYKYWKKYVKESSKFYEDKMMELTENGDRREIQGELRGKETPHHLMYKLPRLHCPENPEIYYEFLIEYDIYDSDVGIYFGVKCISPDGSNHDEAIEIATNHYEKIKPKLCKILNSVFIDKDFSRRFKVTNNANDNTYWPFWISLYEDEDIKKVGVLAINIIKDTYEKLLLRLNPEVENYVAKLKDRKPSQKCLSRFTEDSIKYLENSLDGVGKKEDVDRRVSRLIFEFLDRSLEAGWFKPSGIPGATRGYMFIHKQANRKKAFPIFWKTLLTIVGEKLKLKKKEIYVSWHAVSCVFIAADGSVWDEDNLKSTYGTYEKEVKDNEEYEFWEREILEILERCKL